MEKGWKEVLLTRDEIRAVMARDLLFNAEIPAVIINQRDSSYHDFGDFLLIVPEEFEETARDLIKELKN